MLSQAPLTEREAAAVGLAELAGERAAERHPLIRQPEPKERPAGGGEHAGGPRAGTRRLAEVPRAGTAPGVAGTKTREPRAPLPSIGERLERMRMGEPLAQALEQTALCSDPGVKAGRRSLT